MEEDYEEEDVYTPKGRNELLEDDEITPVEEGFMEGAESYGETGKCANCGKILTGDFIEREINGRVYRFCSEKCAEEFEKRLKEK